jgi:hypothetical protein
MIIRLVCIALLSISISACGVSIKGQDYVGKAPEFSLTDFFVGEVTAWGIVQNRSGEVVQRFIVDIDGSMDGDVLVLDETFKYIVGEGPTTRVWRLTPQPDGTYIGSAGDINGTAVGVAHGNAFNFVYEMDLTVDGSTYTVGFDDWFFAMDDDTLMNRSYIKKFGLVVAEVTIFMQRQDD